MFTFMQVFRVSQSRLGCSVLRIFIFLPALLVNQSYRVYVWHRCDSLEHCNLANLNENILFDLKIAVFVLRRYSGNNVMSQGFQMYLSSHW